MATMNLQEMKAAAAPKSKAELSAMKPKDQIAYLLESKKGEIAKMLPKHLNAERLMKVAQIAATTTPALAKCDVASLIGAIAQCAQMGLEPNTVLGHAYLLPFNTRRGDQWVNSVQVIIGYKGLIDLARRSGQIVSIAAHEVCANDHFDLCYGLNEKLEHKPTLGERGAVIGFYAVAKLKDGGYSFEFMSRKQVEEIKVAGEKKNKRESAVWKDHFVEMGRKTVIRRLAKYLPLSIEFQTAVALDNTASTGGDQHIDNTIDGEFNMVADEDAAMYGADAQQGDVGALENDPSPTLDPIEGNVTMERVERQPAAQQQAAQRQAAPATDEAGKVEMALRNAKDTDTLDLAADLISTVEDADRRDQLRAIYRDRTAEMNAPEAPATAAKPAGRQRGMNLE